VTKAVRPFVSESSFYGSRGMGRLTVVWYVKFRRPDRPIFSIVCLEARQVLENVTEQRSEGCEVWIEDVDGKQVDEKMLAQGQS